MLIALATIGCDRVTKQMALALLAGEPGRSFFADTVRLGLVENAGGFLGLGAGLPVAARTVLFTVGTGLMLAALVVMATRGRWDGWAELGVTLFAAGGVSNWVDRVARGSVVDFLNLGIGPVRTGIFNVADVAIMLGAALLLIDGLWGDEAVPREGDGADPVAPPPGARDHTIDGGDGPEG